MKKALFLLSLVLLTLPAMSQGRKYKKAMGSIIEQMHESTDPVTELELVPGFEEIALAYPDQWLPAYHAARILITGSFPNPEPDEKDLLLEQARQLLDKAFELAPEESELSVLDALYYIGMMSVDPESRGPIYYMNAIEAINTSKSQNPENPRAYYMEGMMTLNMPDFMGGGPGPAKPIFLEAAEKFKTFQSEDPFWPAWGEDLVEAELEGMK
jgi:tetratricopeptide (TPR) repeat protein